MQSRQPSALPSQSMPTPDSERHSDGVAVGYAQQAIRLERALGWVLWIALAIVLFVISV